ncbi:MAG: xanthine dehydrogenase family protein molybdopterin-binding subunit [Saprospirales bacterium]|nr:xanthine dehydrogenase family protein molybdopterin-binding subunit [Saprospirales bacterium]
MSSKHSTSRRRFLKVTAAAGAYLAIGISPAGRLVAATPGKQPGRLPGAEGETELNSYILITPDNKITLFNPRPEMGQGTWQSMPALIAEELEVRLRDVDIRMTAGAKRHGRQSVGGSGSVRQSWIPLRQVGAAAREMLIQTAAKRWNVPASECSAAYGKVLHPATGKSLPYGALVAEAAQLPVPENPRLKDPKDFKILGKPIARPDVPSKVNGSAIFGIDVQVPGILYASVQHCPVIHGKIVRFNAEAVSAMPGVKHVFKTERKMPHKTVDAVAVVATSYWAAHKGRLALDIEWDNGGFDAIATATYFETARKKAADEPGNAYPDEVGKVRTAFASAAKVVEAVYETPFASHAAMEPVTATAWVQGDQVEIWAPVQSSTGVIEEVAQYLGIPQENVKINVLFMGGSFGRKGYYDFVLEAVHISKQIQAPVKLIWTREDDFNNGPYRPGMINALRGALDARGNLIAWEHKVAGEAIGAQVFGQDISAQADRGSGEAIGQQTSPYAIPNRRQAHVHVPTDIPIVWWRSVYSSTNAFGQECFIDEMAHAAGKDPLDFRLELLQAEPRWTALLNRLAEKSGYRAIRAAGHAIGIAIAHSFGSTAAYAITVSPKGNGVAIDRVICVIDCGMTVNPDTVRAQTEGNAIMALSAAAFPAMTFAGGEAQESNYSQYRLPALRDIPPIEVYIMENGEDPGGVGEPGLPPFTPALFNAVFLATGKRIRRLPVDLENLD